MSDCQTCGTGIGSGGNNPKPSDPDNNISLSARTVYGGINVSWTWPTVNEAAVAQTIVYRGSTSNPQGMVELARVGGSIFFDALNPPNDTVYYYWIQIVSVNGTRLPKVGPVSAVAKNRGKLTAEDLTGLIDNSILAQKLREDIAGINEIGRDLIKEIDDRIAANSELSQLMADVQAGVTQAMTYLDTEITKRIEGDSAIVSTLTTMAAAVQDNSALIFQEATVRANADEALSQQTSELYTRTGQNAAAIQQEITTRTNADTAIANSVSTLTTRVGNAETTIQQEANARSAGDQALGNVINGVETSLNGNISTVKTQLESRINLTDGKVTEIGALYTAQVQVNGLIGGFGIYNDGTRVDAGFDVDLFWVGRTQANKVKPFIISNDTVYIDKARIRDADIDTLKIAGNAVTIPLTEARFDMITGNNNPQTVLSRTITMPQAGFLQVLCTCAQSSSGSATTWRLSLRIDGNAVANAAGDAPSDSVSLSGALSVSAGTHTVTLVQTSQTGSRVIDRNFIIFGAMR